MSLVGQALLMVVARAVSGRTWAEDRVLEQPINPLELILRKDAGAGKPALAVYVEQVEGEPVGLETQHGAQTIILKAIAYVPPTVTVVEGEETLRFDDSGAGLVLNVLGRQVDTALHAGDATWVGLFRNFALNVKERKARFLLIELEDGVRVPSIELAYTLTTVPEPEMGQALYGAWAALDAALRDESEGTAIVADIFKGLIENPVDLPAYARLQLAGNYTDAAYMAIGLAPLATDDEEAVGLQEVDVESEFEVIGPPLGGE
jgi:hypothetical protein